MRAKEDSLCKCWLDAIDDSGRDKCIPAHVDVDGSANDAFSLNASARADLCDPDSDIVLDRISIGIGVNLAASIAPACAVSESG